MKRFVLLTIMVGLLFTQTACTKLSRPGVHEIKTFNVNQDVKLTSDRFAKEFESILSAIDSWYAHKERKKINIDQLRSTYLRRVNNAGTMDDFNQILLELFAELRNGHSNVIVPQYSFPARCELVENRLVVTDVVRTSELSRNGVQRGWVITEIDRRAAMEWVQDRFKMVSASTSQGLWQKAKDQVFLRYSSEPDIRHFRFQAPDGQTIDLDLSLTAAGSPGSAFPKPATSSANFGEIGYIAVNTMVDGVLAQFDQALKTMLDKKALILDIRGNGGGNSQNGDEMFRRLIQKDTPLWQRRTAKPYSKTNYSGPIALIVGPYTFSAAESFAFTVADAQRAVVIGQATHGDSGGGPRSFMTDGGIQFRLPTRGLDYSPSGKPMEGSGLVPDLVVEQTYDDLLNNKDTALEAAKAVLLVKIKEQR